MEAANGFHRSKIIRRVFGLPDGQPKVSSGVICTVNSESHENNGFADETGNLGNSWLAKLATEAKNGPAGRLESR